MIPDAYNNDKSLSKSAMLVVVLHESLSNTSSDTFTQGLDKNP